MTTDLLHEPDLSHLVIPAAPPPPRHDESTFYGLVEEGCRYGLASYGDTLKVVFLGHEAFQRRGINLLCSFGEAWAVKRVTNDISTVVSGKVNTLNALRLYLYTQLVARQEADIYDEDGCWVSVGKPLDEEALSKKANDLAEAFYATHFTVEYASVNHQSSPHSAISLPYSIGRIRAENPGD